MRKQIFILKTGVYDPRFGVLDKYSSYEYVTRQKYSPPLKETESLEKLQMHFKKQMQQGVECIYCSQATRTFETARLILTYFSQKDRKIVAISELNEVKFSLKELLTREEYEKFGSNLVRERFIEFFMEDRLMESRKQLKKRVQRLLAKLRDSQENKFLLISHSFFMKLLQIYLREPALFESPEALKTYFDPYQRTFDCGDGFSFCLEQCVTSEERKIYG